jgi:hypothetical protein
LIDMRESSVVTSLEELRKLEEQRRAEEAEERARAEAARREAEERAMIEARERAAAHAREDRESAIRAAVAEAQIEAEKRARIENSRMAVQLALQAEAIARHEAHARELAAMTEARRLDERKGHRSTLLGALAFAAAMVAAVLAMRAGMQSTPPPAAPATVPTHDDSAQRQIEELEKQLAILRAAQQAPSAPVASVTTKPTIHPQPKDPKPAGGPKCPPGVHGIPLCP